VILLFNLLGFSAVSRDAARKALSFRRAKKKKVKASVRRLERGLFFYVSKGHGET